MNNILSTIKAIVFLQIDGRRSLATYYDDSINQKQFERHLYAKTKTPKAKDEIIAIDGFLVVHRFITDSHIYVVGGRNENPLILDCVLNCIVEVVSSLAGNSVVNNTVMDNLSRVILALDEICDSGLILEIDPSLVLQRVTATNEESVESMAQRTARRFFGL